MRCKSDILVTVLRSPRLGRLWQFPSAGPQPQVVSTVGEGAESPDALRQVVGAKPQQERRAAGNPQVMSGHPYRWSPLRAARQIEIALTHLLDKDL